MKCKICNIECSDTLTNPYDFNVYKSKEGSVKIVWNEKCLNGHAYKTGVIVPLFEELISE